MRYRARQIVIAGVLALGSSVLAGCPSVDPGSVAPPLLEGDVGLHFQASCHFSGPAKGNPTAAQDRVTGDFDTNFVRAYRLYEKDNVLTADKAILNHPGLLQTLEINRFLSGFVLGCAEDQTITFYRKEDLVKTEAVKDEIERELARSGELVVSLANQAFYVYEDVTPQIYTFKQPALKIPIEKAELGFKPEASRMTLTIRDEKLIAELQKKLGWPGEDDPSYISNDSFADQISRERVVYAVVAGIVMIEDVIRPGAQLVIDDEGTRWMFGGFVRDRERTWAEALFKRDDGRTISRYVIRSRRIDLGD